MKKVRSLKEVSEEDCNEIYKKIVENMGYLREENKITQEMLYCKI